MNLMAPLEMAAPSFLAWIAPALLVIDALGQEHDRSIALSEMVLARVQRPGDLPTMEELWRACEQGRLSLPSLFPDGRRVATGWSRQGRP